MLVVNEQRKEKYEKQLADLEKYAIGDLDESDELAWMSRGMYNLVRFMYENSQYMDVRDSGEVQLVSRVIKVDNYIPRILLDMGHIPYVSFLGIYCVVDLYYIPVSLFEKNTRGCSGKWVISPEKYGLPSIEDAIYGSMKLTTDGYYGVLARTEKSRLISEYLTSVDNYHVVY